MSERQLLKYDSAFKNYKKLPPVAQRHIDRYKYAASIIETKEPRVLDIACGAGYGSKHLAISLSGSEVVAVDVSKEALDFAKKFNDHRNIEWVQGNIIVVKKLVFPKFDAIVCFETLEHLSDGQDEVLEQFVDLLNEGCPAICSIPLNHPDKKWHKKIFNFQEREELFQRHFNEITYSDVNGSLIVGRNL